MLDPKCCLDCLVSTYFRCKRCSNSQKFYLRSHDVASRIGDVRMPSLGPHSFHPFTKAVSVCLNIALKPEFLFYRLDRVDGFALGSFPHPDCVFVIPLSILPTAFNLLNTMSIALQHFSAHREVKDALFL